MPVLLVACDFDGTLAPIVDEPSSARPDAQSVAALRGLAQLPQTHAVVISGRGLKDLTKLIGEVNGVELVGSHGCEYGDAFTTELSATAQMLLSTLASDLADITKRHPGTRLEHKPASVAVHYRGMDENAAQAVQQAVLEGPARREGVYVRPGKKVIELAVVEMSKGRALQTLRFRHAAAAVLFFGDDRTDEEGFATLAPPDLGVKVGDGESLASHFVEGVEDVRAALELLLATRERFLAQFTQTPIEEHSMLSDQRSAALVTPNGRIVWLCLPRIDGSAIFSELLDGPYAGHFTVAAADGSSPVGKRYLDHSFVLETRWNEFFVMDYMDCSHGRPFRRAGRTDLIRVIQGSGRVAVTFAPRMDFGRMATRLAIQEDGLEVDGALEPIVLRSPGVAWQLVDDGPHQYATAEIELGAEPVVLELRYGTGNLEPSSVNEKDRREQTIRFWTSWLQAISLPTVAPELVRRSALVLRGLFHGPTGAIAAAATTSLPEHFGGVRNWDYRYCWPRDAAMAAAALVRLGTTGQAMKFLDWFLGVLDNCPSPEYLSPVYTVAGGHLMSEAELGGLQGYRGSRPIRIGNLAAQQVQLDVFGPIVDLVALLGESGAALSTEHWRLVEMMVTAVEARWGEPDHGIWEIRKARQHHVHSKVMCWLTVQRGLVAARWLGRKRPHWSDLRDAIAQDILAKGYKPSIGAFTATYEDDDADASTLAVGLCGLVAPDDPRFIGTVELVERELRDGPTVYRYHYEDGLPGPEGGFHLCTTWLIEAYAMIGRRDDAEELFRQYTALAGPTGLYSEEYDPEAGLALGNFPQAYSHLGLINAALRLSQT